MLGMEPPLGARRVPSLTLVAFAPAPVPPHHPTVHSPGSPEVGRAREDPGWGQPAVPGPVKHTFVNEVQHNTTLQKRKCVLLGAMPHTTRCCSLEVRIKSPASIYFSGKK